MYGTNEQEIVCLGEVTWKEATEHTLPEMLRYYVRRLNVTALQITRYRDAFREGGERRLKKVMREDTTLPLLELIVVALEKGPYTNPAYGGKVLTHQYEGDATFRVRPGDGKSSFFQLGSGNPKPDDSLMTGK